MKNLKLFIILVAVSCIGACNSDDDDGASNTGLNGTWYLVKAIVPDSGTTEDFNKGDIKWNINESTKQVTTSDSRMQVMTPEPSGMYSYPDGTYNYQIDAWGGTCDNSFHIDEYNFGCVILDKNSLTLTTEAVDGVRYSFVR